MGLLQRLLVLVGIAAVPLAGVELYNWTALRQERGAEAAEAAGRLLASVAAEHGRLADGVRFALAGLVAEAPSASEDPAACDVLMRDLERGRPPWLVVHVHDGSGTVRCSSREDTVGTDASGRRHVREALAGGGFVVGDLIRLQADGRAALPYAVRWEADGRRGTVSALVDAEWMAATLSERPLPPNTALVLADRGGTVIAAYPEGFAGAGSAVPAAFRALLAATSEGLARVVGEDGVARVVAYSPAGAGPLAGVFVAVGVDEAAAMASVDDAARRALALFAVTLAATLGLAFYGGRRYLREPLEAVVAAAERFRDGDRSARARLGGGGEVARVGAAFDQMAEAIAAGDEARRRVEGAERALADAARLAQASEARYAAMFEVVVDPMVVIDAKGVLRAFNKSAERTFGYAAAEVVGRNVTLLMPEGFRGGHDGHLSRYVSTGERKVIGIGRELLAQRRDGTTFPIDASVAEWVSGGERLFVGVLRDITARKAAEDAIRASEEQFRLVFEEAPVGMERVARDGSILDVNRKLCEMLGYPREELLSLPYAEITAPEYRAAEGADVARLFAGEVPSYAVEKRYLRKDGSGLWVRVTSSLARGKADASPYRISVVEDITASRHAAEAMRKAVEAAEEANRSKTRFLAAASHDLRQPMQSLFFFAAAMDRHVQSDEGREQLAHLQRGLDALKALLDSLLDVSRLDANAVTPVIQDFPIGPLLDHIAASYAPVAAGKGLGWLMVPCQSNVRSDRTLLGRMLRNLIENAVRYTDRGRVLIDCKPVGGSLRIEVSDTGVGIAKDEVARIWDEFHQVGNKERDRTQGMGLGLAIVQRLSRLLGHPVSVSSVPGQGSVFAIEVPLGEARPAAPPPQSEAAPLLSGEGRLALVVDDDAIVLMGLQSMLRDWGYKVIIAGDADTAMDRLRGMGRRPDVMVADYRLRDGRVGTEAILLVRTWAGDPPVPAMILTGEIGPEPARDAQEHGLGLIHKPVTPRQLSAALGREMGQEAAAS